jgi:hypothetical protein
MQLLQPNYVIPQADKIALRADSGYLKLKDKEVYFSEVFLGSEFGIDDAEQLFEEVANVPTVNAFLEQQLEILDKVPNSKLDVAKTKDDWKNLVGKTVLPDYECSFGSTDYKCLQKHIIQYGWEPPSVPALWLAVPTVTDGGYPLWKQPTGAHDAYNTGDKVVLSEVVYTSKIDGNTTDPGSDERWWEAEQT